MTGAPMTGAETHSLDLLFLEILAEKSWTDLIPLLFTSWKEKE
jgi:hypothetical protein